MKYLLSLLLLASSLTPFVAQADIAPDPGTHTFYECAYIDNLADYPDYDVYVTLNWRFGPSPMLASAPTNTCSLIKGASTGTPFIAVKKSNQEKITHEQDPGGEQGDIWSQLAENKAYIIEQAEFGGTVKTGIVIGASEEIFASGGNLPDSNPAVHFISIFHIDSLTDSAFTVHLVSEDKYDKSGNLVGSSSSTTPSTTDDSTVVPETLEAPVPVALMSVVIICLGAILVTVAMKTWKK